MQFVHRDAGAGLYRLSAHVTTGRIGEGGLLSLPCSRNARSRTPLIGRAQWETDSGYPPGEGASELGGSIRMCGVLTIVNAYEQDSPFFFPNGAKWAS